MNYAIHFPSPGLITSTVSSLVGVTVPNGQQATLLTSEGFALICSLRAQGKRSVMENGVPREATASEGDGGKKPIDFLLEKVKGIANLTNRAAAYSVLNDVKLALENKDKEGAKAIVAASALPAGVKTTATELIDRN